MIGAVLTGGASRRMGRDKALLTVDGVAMVRRSANLLAEVGCAPVVAVGPSALADGLEYLDDDHPGEGPLGAILTVLGRNAPALVIACDLPALDAMTLLRLLGAPRVDVEGEEVDVVMAATSRAEPLCAVWMPSALPALQQAFAAGERAVHRCLSALTVAFVAVPQSTLRNANTPDDLTIR